MINVTTNSPIYSYKREGITKIDRRRSSTKFGRLWLCYINKTYQGLVKFTQQHQIPFQWEDPQAVLQTSNIQQQFPSQIQNTSKIVQQFQMPPQI